MTVVVVAVMVVVVVGVVVVVVAVVVVVVATVVAVVRNSILLRSQRGIFTFLPEVITDLPQPDTTTLLEQNPFMLTRDYLPQRDTTLRPEQNPCMLRRLIFRNSILLRSQSRLPDYMNSFLPQLDTTSLPETNSFIFTRGYVSQLDTPTAGWW